MEEQGLKELGAVLFGGVAVGAEVEDGVDAVGGGPGGAVEACRGGQFAVERAEEMVVGRVRSQAQRDGEPEASVAADAFLFSDALVHT